MEWKKVNSGFRAATSRIGFFVYEAFEDEWEGIAEDIFGPIKVVVARADMFTEGRSLLTVDEAKAAIVAKVREILTKELEALG